MIVVKILVVFYEVWNVIDVSRDFIINYVYVVIYCVFYWKYDKIIFFFLFRLWLFYLFVEFG